MNYEESQAHASVHLKSTCILHEGNHFTFEQNRSCGCFDCGLYCRAAVMAAAVWTAAIVVARLLLSCGRYDCGCFDCGYFCHAALIVLRLLCPFGCYWRIPTEMVQRLFPFYFLWSGHTLLTVPRYPKLNLNC